MPVLTVERRILGFTLIELVVVIILLGILVATALPRFTEMDRAARMASLESLAGAMRTTTLMVKSKAKLAGLNTRPDNPGPGQAAYIVDTNLGSAEVDYRSLCPESSAELGDALDMPDFMTLNITSDMTVQVTNQFTRIGFDVTNNTSNGCYVSYDSFHADCLISVITADC